MLAEIRIVVIYIFAMMPAGIVLLLVRFHYTTPHPVEHDHSETII